MCVYVCASKSVYVRAILFHKTTVLIVKISEGNEFVIQYHPRGGKFNVPNLMKSYKIYHA